MINLFLQIRAHNYFTLYMLLASKRAGILWGCTRMSPRVLGLRHAQIFLSDVFFLGRRESYLLSLFYCSMSFIHKIIIVYRILFTTPSSIRHSSRWLIHQLILSWRCSCSNHWILRCTSKYKLDTLTIVWLQLLIGTLCPTLPIVLPWLGWISLCHQSSKGLY